MKFAAVLLFAVSFAAVASAASVALICPAAMTRPPSTRLTNLAFTLPQLH